MPLQTALSLLIIGLIAGGIATGMLRRKGPSLVVNLVIGVAGAFLGNFVYHQISLELVRLLVATGGAVLLLWLASLFKK